MTWRRLVVLGIAMKVLGVAGMLIPRYLIRDGVDNFRDDPLAYATASDAYKGAQQMNHRVGKLLLPGARVRRVWREPGHCTGTRTDDPRAEYRAEVRMYTWFGIPGPVIHAQCGGSYSSRTASAPRSTTRS